MAVAYASKGTIGHAVGGNVDVPYPATVNNGDVLILQCVNFSSGATITTPSGWTELFKSAKQSSFVWAYYIKRADGTETGNLTVTMASGLNSLGMISRWTGCKLTGTFYEDEDSTDHQQSSTATTSAVTSTGDDHLAVALTTVHDDVSIGAWSGSFVQDFEDDGTDGYGWAMEAASQQKYSAGTVAAETSSLGGTDYHCVCTLFLIPEPEGYPNKVAGVENVGKVSTVEAANISTVSGV